MSRQSILNEINTERDLQDVQWGGPTHDDVHAVNDWIAILARHLGLAASDEGKVDPERFRRQLIRIAAVAVAAAESSDRRTETEKAFGLPPERRGSDA